MQLFGWGKTLGGGNMNTQDINILDGSGLWEGGEE